MLTQVAHLHSSICVTRRCGALPTADAFSQLFLVKFHWSSWHVGRFLDGKNLTFRLLAAQITK